MKRRQILAGMGGVLLFGPWTGAQSKGDWTLERPGRFVRLHRPGAPGEHWEAQAVGFPGLLQRNVRVWLPTGPQASPLRVLLVHDGQNMFDPGHSFGGEPWGLDLALQSLIDQGETPPTLVVAVENSANRYAEYVPEQPVRSLDTRLQRLAFGSREGVASRNGAEDALAETYLAFLFQRVLPQVQARFSEATGPVSVMGSSMGGLISLYALCRYPDRVSAAACLSTHWVMSVNQPLINGGGQDALAIAQSYRDWLRRHLPVAGRHRLYFDHGTVALDALYAPHQQAVDALMAEKGYRRGEDWKTEVFVGAEHNERAWRARLKIPLKHVLA